MTDTGVDLLPSNVSPFMRAMEKAIGRQITPIDADAVRRAKGGLRFTEAPIALLPWLAWEESVDAWNPDWTPDQKRAVIAASWEAHRLKGTPAAMAEALGGLGYELRFEEWFQYGGLPYRFRIEINIPATQTLTDDEFDAVINTAIVAKNVRSFLESVTWVRGALEGPVYVGVAPHTVMTVLLDTETTYLAEPGGPVFIGAHLRSIQTFMLG